LKDAKIVKLQKKLDKLIEAKNTRSKQANEGTRHFEVSKGQRKKAAPAAAQESDDEDDDDEIQGTGPAVGPAKVEGETTKVLAAKSWDHDMNQLEGETTKVPAHDSRLDDKGDVVVKCPYGSRSTFDPTSVTVTGELPIKVCHYSHKLRKPPIGTDGKILWFCTVLPQDKTGTRRKYISTFRQHWKTHNLDPPPLLRNRNQTQGLTDLERIKGDREDPCKVLKKIRELVMVHIPYPTVANDVVFCVFFARSAITAQLAEVWMRRSTSFGGKGNLTYASTVVLANYSKDWCEYDVDIPWNAPWPQMPEYATNNLQNIGTTAGEVISKRKLVYMMEGNSKVLKGEWADILLEFTDA
jgi:hypothetical protein